MKKFVQLLTMAGIIALAPAWCQGQDFWARGKHSPPADDRFEFFWDDSDQDPRRESPDPQRRRDRGPDDSFQTAPDSDDRFEFQWETDAEWFNAWYES